MHVQTQQFDDWRRSEQQVRHKWEAWLAADGRERAVAYRAFEAALAEEERAAGEIERAVGRSSRDRSTCDLLPSE